MKIIKDTKKVPLGRRNCPRKLGLDEHQLWNGPLQSVADSPAGYSADPNDTSTMNFRDNFTGFWNIWKHGIVKRNYVLLDEIHPNRIRSAEQWLRREEELAKREGKASLWERLQPANFIKQTVPKYVSFCYKRSIARRTEFLTIASGDIFSRRII